MSISYTIQPSPGGLAQAFLIGVDFVGADPCALVLGDNMFHGSELAQKLGRANTHSDSDTVFAYRVRNAERFGVMERDPDSKAFGIEEELADPRSRLAVTGLDVYGSQVVEIAFSFKPSARGELEVADVNRVYLDRHELSVEVCGCAVALLDADTHEVLLQASHFVERLEKRQGLKIGLADRVGENGRPMSLFARSDSRGPGPHTGGQAGELSEGVPVPCLMTRP